MIEILLPLGQKVIPLGQKVVPLGQKVCSVTLKDIPKAQYANPNTLKVRELAFEFYMFSCFEILKKRDAYGLEIDLPEIAKPSKSFDLKGFSAEGEGFEPSVPLQVHTLSRRASSTTPAPVLNFGTQI